MDPVLALALVAVAGIVATRLPMLATRALYLEHATALAVLGLVLGPLAGVLNDATLNALSPAVALAAGWVGLRLGTRFELRTLRRVQPRLWAVVLAQAVAVTLGVALLVWLLTLAVPELAAAWRPVLPAALALGAIAVVSGPESVEQVADRLGLSPGRRGVLTRLAALDSMAGFLLFTLALAVYHPRGPGGASLGVPLWMLLALAGGVLAGMLFLALTRRAADLDRFTVDLVAVVLLAAGLGYAADLSPFLICATAGALIVNRTPHRQQVLQVLADWEDPLAALLLIVAGATLRLPTWWLLPAVALLAATRLLLRWGAARAIRARRGQTDLPPDAGLATAPQGTLAVALGLNYAVTYSALDAAATGGFLTTVVVGAVLAQLAAPALVTRALRAIPASRPTPDPQETPVPPAPDAEPAGG